MSKRFWRCNVCNDIHYGMAGPKICPTCGAENAYAGIDAKEAVNLQETSGAAMTPEELRDSWERFTENNEFILNPDKAHVDMIVQGVLVNEKKHGLKLCPCRLRNGKRERDLELICPCNFKTHDTWRDKGMCWCGLFVRRPETPVKKVK